jgi:hypothetical protein
MDIQGVRRGHIPSLESKIGHGHWGSLKSVSRLGVSSNDA